MKLVLAVVATILAVPASAATTIFSFGGVFASNAPSSPFSNPDRSFDASFVVPKDLRGNANTVSVVYQTAGRTETRNGFFNLSANPGQRQGFTLSLNDPFSFQALNIVFAADDFFRLSKSRAILSKGNFALYDGRAVATSLFGGASGDIVNPTGLRIFSAPSPRASFSASAAVGAVPEASTWAMMIAGFGLVGGVARRRAHGVVTA